MAEKLAELAERFFRGIYGGDPSVVYELASENIILSYPVFEKIYQTQTIRGRRAVKEFGFGFSRRWTDIQLTIHESISQGGRVVLLWSFHGREAEPTESEMYPTNLFHDWGGITLFRFDSLGKIEAEIGEESSPGPYKRSGSTDDG